MAPTIRQRKGKLVKVHDEIKPKSSVKRGSSAHSHIAYLILLITLAGTISIGHRTFLSTLFENDRHFSHLSALERELAFRTEMGFYFSYFKTIISADSFINGLYKIMKDNITEYPSTINTLKRFNLYPEVIIGATYRIFQATTDSLNIRTKTCWTVNRGEGLSPVLSCEGLGEPAYFYVEAAFLLNGLMMGFFFLFGAYLSESLFGGLITVACFMFNHGEATRVMWTPPLRESFGYPLFVLQMFIVTYVIREKKESSKYSILIACSQICFMLSWQFAQFALLTQTIAAFALYMLQYISNAICKVILLGQTIGLLVSFVLLFGNEMLLTSFFASSLLAAWIVTVLWKYYQRLGYRLLILLSEGITFILLTIISKLLLAKIFQLEDDAHIGEILRSKFTTFQNFHTMLYTCAKEFDFIEYETIWKLLMTLLIPSGLVAFIAVLIHLVKVELNGNKIATKDLDNNLKSTNLKARDGAKPGAEYFYHTLQLIAFTLMALLIMRLKLFWTPHLCLYSSLLASRQIFPLGKKETHMMVLAALFACMAFTGVTNLQVQLGRLGEFSNLPQEELVEWIKAKTPENAVFAGAMPTMATVKLTTLRPIVNHPHYEDIGLRERTKLVYSIYSRKPLQEVKANLDKLGVNFIILEDPWCSQRSKPGCSLPEIWDIEDFENRGKQAACNKIKKNPEPFFKPVFKNQGYHVYQLVRS